MVAKLADTTKLWAYKRALARELLGENTLLREATPDLSEDRTRFDLMFYKGKLGIRGPKKSDDPWDFEFNENFSVDTLHPQLRTFIEEVPEMISGFEEFFEAAQIRFRCDTRGTYGMWIDTQRDNLEKFSQSALCEKISTQCRLELGQKFDFLPPAPHAWLPSFSKDNQELWLKSYISSFSQPGPEANRALIACGIELLEEFQVEGSWVEVGAGYGNLTAAFTTQLGNASWVLEKESRDSLLFEANREFFPQSRYITKSVESFSEENSPLLMLADPPRSGFSEFFKKDLIKSSYLLLYNCDLKGLIKDFEALSANYMLRKWSLIDLFPGTPYVEAVTLWQRRV